LLLNAYFAGESSRFTHNRQCAHREWNAEHLAEWSPCRTHGWRLSASPTCRFRPTELLPDGSKISMSNCRTTVFGLMVSIPWYPAAMAVSASVTPCTLSITSYESRTRMSNQFKIDAEITLNDLGVAGVTASRRVRVYDYPGPSKHSRYRPRWRQRYLSKRGRVVAGLRERWLKIRGAYGQSTSRA
jgi:hypothetical protein